MTATSPETRRREAVPYAGLGQQRLKHNQALHETVILLTVKSGSAPRVAEGDRLQIESLRPDIHRVTLTYGFMETPNIVGGLTRAREKGLRFDIMTTSFFLSRRALAPTRKSSMPWRQDLLYVFLARNATNATEFFRIPTSRVVELGAQVAI